MKALRIASLMFVLLALFAGLGALTASADGPVASLNTSNVSFIDNQAHPIQPNADLWYRFNYAVNADGTRPITTINVVDGNASGVNFEVWTPDAVTDLTDNSPVGRGESFNVPCLDGTCTSPDLRWVGAFTNSGTYYVHVINTNSFATTAKVTISGDGVQLSPIAVTSSSASAQPVSTIDDPTKAVALNGSQQNIPANSATWYRFDYTLNDDGTRPTKTIRLMNGEVNGLTFEVYSPENINNWWQNNPTGTGNAEVVACDSGTCQTNDQIWTGAFGSSGTYYVRVINGSANAVPATLTIQ